MTWDFGLITGLRILWRKLWLTPTQRRDLDRRLAIACMRQTFALFGVDTSDMTDEDIERGAIAFGEAVISSAATAQQAADNLSALFASLNYEGVKDSSKEAHA